MCFVRVYMCIDGSKVVGESYMRYGEVEPVATVFLKSLALDCKVTSKRLDLTHRHYMVLNAMSR